MLLMEMQPDKQAQGEAVRAVRLAYAAKSKRKVPMREVAELLQISENTYRSYEMNVRIPLKHAQQLAGAWGFPVSAFYKDSVEPLRYDLGEVYPARTAPTIRIPIVGNVSAGNGEYNVDRDPDSYIDVPATLALHNEIPLAWRVSGDSMMPALQDGDVAIFRASRTTPRNRHAYLLRGEHGDLLLKILRYEHSTGEWLATSLNPSYQPKSLAGTQILGTLVGFCRTQGSRIDTALDPEGLMIED